VVWYYIQKMKIKLLPHLIQNLCTSQWYLSKILWECFWSSIKVNFIIKTFHTFKHFCSNNFLSFSRMTWVNTAYTLESCLIIKNTLKYPITTTTYISLQSPAQTVHKTSLELSPFCYPNKQLKNPTLKHYFLLYP